MLKYNRELKTHACALRQNMTDAEQALWSKLRRKQIHGMQFYRQKPIGCYIVDFYAPSAKLVVELDGSQHFEREHVRRDAVRDSYLQGLGLQVLRFDNLQVLRELEAVLDEIARVVGERVNPNQKPNPPQPPFCKGGSELVSTDISPLEEEVDDPTLTNILTSERGVNDPATNNIPPFAKGGLGGIYGLSDFSETPETTDISK